MKNTITTISIILLTAFAIDLKAQNNLQLSQILLLSSTVATDANLGTVPSGKIWKIESYGGNSNSTVGGMINGSSAGWLNKVPTGSFPSNTYILQNSFTLPIWLPAGTQLGFSGNTAGVLVWFSIIEFNVVP